ncbi:hypothetical protein FLWE109334_00290 [Flavobacterium weaverense]|uniref:Uncharacterized protein n=1 Tax=Flavobacterium weaverense TaxID=271156 RepID=A0A3M0ADX3_9FLAO|nr:hypothetical protein BC961_1353 [Flavobacterium weaverense]
MSATKYVAKTFQLLKNLNFRNKRKKSNDFINELIDSRFGVSINDNLAQTKVPNSLLFLMYSKENETLFI